MTTIEEHPVPDTMEEPPVSILILEAQSSPTTVPPTHSPEPA